MVGIHVGMLLPPAVALGAIASRATELLNFYVSTRRQGGAWWLVVLFSALATWYVILLRPRKDATAATGLV